MPLIPLIVGVAVVAWLAARAERGEDDKLTRAYVGFRTRRRRVRAFPVFFSIVVGVIAIWLLAGLAPAIVRLSPGLHETLHRWGGAPDPQRVTADTYSFDRSEVTLLEGDVVLEFRNEGEEPHNIAIYRDASARESLFIGDVVVATERVVDGDYTEFFGGTTYRFRSPARGTYFFRCDVHPTTMTGRVLVAAPGELPTGSATTGFFAETWRRVAEASHGADRGAQVLIDYAFSFVNVGLGIALVLLRPRDRVARYFGVGMVATAAAYNLQSHAALTVIPDLAGTLHFFVVHPYSGFGYLGAVFLFPDGDVVPRWSRVWVRIPYRVAILVAGLVLISASGILEPGDHTVALVEFFGLMVPVVGIAAQSYRIRRARVPERKQQARLLLWALTPALVAGIVFAFANAGRFAAITGQLQVAPTTEFRVFQFVFAVIPFALAVGILRYRLWDIEIVLSKTVVFGALAGFVGAVYVAVVVGIGQLVGTRGDPNTILALAATGIVAIAFEPVRRAAARLAGRIVYGERATPYEAIRGFSERIADALSVGEVLPQIAGAAVPAIGAMRTRVRLFLPGGGERVERWPGGDAVDDRYDRLVPVVNQGETLGEIAVAKAPGDPITEEQGRLLADIANAAGIAMRNIRLAVELSAQLDVLSAQAAEIAASRQRLVDARAAELRRHERAISEHVERRLEEAARLLTQAIEVLGAEPERAAVLLEEVGERTSVALEALRELVRGIFPKLLADRGVASALEAHAMRADVPVTLDVDASVADARFDPHIEAAIYFCCVQALDNVARHAGDAGARVSIAMDGPRVRFDIVDEGRGFDPGALPWTGLRTMADRVEALGGTFEVASRPGSGTAVHGWVPADAAVPANV